MNINILPPAICGMQLSKEEMFDEDALEEAERVFNTYFNEITNPTEVLFVAPGFEKKEEEEDDDEEQDVEMADESDREFDDYPEELQTSLEF